MCLWQIVITTPQVTIGRLSKLLGRIVSSNLNVRYQINDNASISEANFQSDLAGIAGYNKNER